MVAVINMVLVASFYNIFEDDRSSVRTYKKWINGLNYQVDSGRFYIGGGQIVWEVKLVVASYHIYRFFACVTDEKKNTSISICKRAVWSGNKQL